eukprot:gene2053-1559_t
MTQLVKLLLLLSTSVLIIYFEPSWGHFTTRPLKEFYFRHYIIYSTIFAFGILLVIATDFTKSFVNFVQFGILCKKHQLTLKYSNPDRKLKAQEFVQECNKLGGVYTKLCQYFGTKGANGIDSEYLKAFSNANEAKLEKPKNHFGHFINEFVGKEWIDTKGNIQNLSQIPDNLKELNGLTLQKPSIVASVGAISFITNQKGEPKYVLKTIRPEVRKSLYWDIMIIQTLLPLSQFAVWKEMKDFLENAVPEVCRNIQDEVDLTIEFNNLKKARANVSNISVSLPKVLELKDPNILIMSCASGTSLKEWLSTKPDYNTRVETICRISEFYAYSLMVQNFSQSDFHSGNAFVEADKQNLKNLTIIDYGLCVSLEQDLKEKFACLFQEIFKFYDFVDQEIIDNVNSQNAIHGLLGSMNVEPACGREKVIKMITEICFPSENSLFPQMNKINPKILYPIALLQSLTGMYREMCSTNGKETKLQQLIILLPFSYYASNTKRLNYKELISLHDCAGNMLNFFPLFDIFPVRLSKHFKTHRLADFIIQTTLSKYSNKKYQNREILPSDYMQKLITAVLEEVIPGVLSSNISIDFSNEDLIVLEYFSHQEELKFDKLLFNVKLHGYQSDCHIKVPIKLSGHEYILHLKNVSWEKVMFNLFFDKGDFNISIEQRSDPNLKIGNILLESSKSEEPLVDFLKLGYKTDGFNDVIKKLFESGDTTFHMYIDSNGENEDFNLRLKTPKDVSAEKIFNSTLLLFLETKSLNLIEYVLRNYLRYMLLGDMDGSIFEISKLELTEKPIISDSSIKISHVDSTFATFKFETNFNTIDIQLAPKKKVTLKDLKIKGTSNLEVSKEFGKVLVNLQKVDIQVDNVFYFENYQVIVQQFKSYLKTYMEETEFLVDIGFKEPAVELNQINLSRKVFSNILNQIQVLSKALKNFATFDNLKISVGECTEDHFEDIRVENFNFIIEHPKLKSKKKTEKTYFDFLESKEMKIIKKNDLMNLNAKNLNIGNDLIFDSLSLNFDPTDVLNSQIESFKMRDDAFEALNTIFPLKVNYSIQGVNRKKAPSFYGTIKEFRLIENNSYFVILNIRNEDIHLKETEIKIDVNSDQMNQSLEFDCEVLNEDSIIFTKKEIQLDNKSFKIDLEYSIN